jgi:hypothetical protein
MMPKGIIMYLWAGFLLLGIISFALQIHHNRLQINKFKNDNNIN